MLEDVLPFRGMEKIDWIHFGKLLGNATRLNILHLLWHNNPMHVTEIAEELDIPVKTASHNLILLERKGILKASGKSSRMFYGIASDLEKAARDVLGRIMRDLS